jgi:hypothetical protein
MVRKAEVLKLVHGHVTHVLLVAQSSLPSSQFQAFRTVVLNEFGRNGLEGELEQLEHRLGLEERNGSGRNI